EALLLEACAYVAGDVLKQINTKLVAWVSNYKKAAEEETRVILNKFGEDI
ncbi:unnamed protein product, partial [marine sediment metagenome]